jgi:starch phosphorylase
MDSHIFIIREIKRNKQTIFGIECPEIFDILYTENRQKRLAQEIAIGKIVPEILKMLNVRPDIVWLNESHTSLAIPQIREDPYFEGTRNFFTIHTPEQAGMERFYDYRFDHNMVADPEKYRSIFVQNNTLDLTWAAMVLSDAVSAVSREHAETTKKMFSQFRSKIFGIRNGTDSHFWTYPLLKEELDKNPDLSERKLLEIHNGARLVALEFIAQKSGIRLDTLKPTVWFVRRFSGYKNLYPMLKDILPAVCAERGERIRTEIGEFEGLGMQIVSAGRAAETDNECLWWMSEFTRLTRENLKNRFVFIPEYTLDLLQMGAWGADVWLATPKLGREACGTGDQRAQINGIPVITSRTGGPMEYLEEYDEKNESGSGFFIEPYTPAGLYQKLKIFSKIWYEWQNKKSVSYPKIKHNSFLKGRELDIKFMLAEYKKIFERLMF